MSFLRLSAGIDGQPVSRVQNLIENARLRTLKRLGSGLKLSSDEPGEFAGANQFRAQAGSLTQAVENVGAGINRLATAEGALQVVSDLLVKLREITVEAANFTDETSRTALQLQADEIIGTIDRIGGTTRSATTTLFNGDFQRTTSLTVGSGIGAVSGFVPSFSKLTLGDHRISLRSAGGVVTAVDTSAATVGDGEYGKVTDAPGVKSSPMLTSSTFVFETGSTWYSQDATGLDPATALTTGFTGVTDVQIHPDGTGIIFEADGTTPGTKNIYKKTFAGVTTTLAEGVDDSDYDITAASASPGTVDLVWVSDSDFSVTPTLSEISAMTFNTSSDTLWVADKDAGTGGKPAMVEYHEYGGTVTGTVVDLAPVFTDAGATIDGLAHIAGSVYTALDGTNGKVHTFSVAGGVATPVSTFSTATATVGTETLTTAITGAASITGAAAVTTAADVEVKELLTMSFTDTAGGLTYGITGAESGTQIAAGTAFTSGTPLTVDGITFTITGEGASRGGKLAATTVATGATLDISVDGGPVTTVTLAATTGGAAIATELESKIEAATGTDVSVAFDSDAADTRYIISSTTGGSITVTDAAGPSNVADDLKLGVANGGAEFAGAGILSGDTYTIDVTGAGVTAAGLAYDGTSLRIGDSATDHIYTYSTAGVQASGGIEYTSAGSIARLEHDSSTGTGSLFIVNSAGTIFEYDDDPAAGTTPSILGTTFTPAGTTLGIARFPTFDNLFIGSSAGAVTQWTNGGVDTGKNIYHEDLTTSTINQLSGEGGDESDPEIASAAAKVAYLTAAGGIITRTVSGGSATTFLAAGATSIDDINTAGTHVAYTTGGGSSVVEMSTSTVTATGSGQKFNPAGTHLYYESGGEIIRLTLAGGATTTLTGVGAIPTGSSDFSISPDGSLLAYTSGTDIYVIAADGSSATATAITETGDPPGDGSSPSFSSDSSQVIFVGSDSEIWIREASGSNIPVLPSGGAFSSSPSVAATETLVKETFTLEVITDVDGADVFSVTGSVSGAHATATAGVAYTSDAGIDGLGAGLSFTIATGGQYAVGTKFTIDTDFAFGASLDGGPEVIVPSGSEETLYAPDGSVLEATFGTIVPSAPTSQSFLVLPGGEVQSERLGTPYDRVPFYIDLMNSDTLGLTGLDVTAFEPAIGSTSTTGALTLSGISIDSSEKVTIAQTYKLEFTSPTLFNITGSESGPIKEDVAYTSGSEIKVDNLTFTVSGTASTGNTVTIELGSSSNVVDNAIDKVLYQRQSIGSAIQVAESANRYNLGALGELTSSISELADVEYGAELARLARQRVIGESTIAVQAQSNFARDRVIDLLNASRPSDLL